MDFSNFFDFFYGILAGIFSALFISRFIEPLYDSTVDALNSNNSFIGKAYKKYIYFITKIFYSNTLHPALRHENDGYEYKLYVSEGVLKAYASRIVILRQNVFKRIQGEMERLQFSGNTIQTFFKAYIKSKDQNYLVWEERYLSNKGVLQINAQYKLSDTHNKDIIGKSIEQDGGKIVSCLSIISFNTVYNTVTRISEVNPEVIKYLKAHHIDLETLSASSRKFIFKS
ncbi:hypothetical protein KORDIASMS9_03277 [Kordia sp. SMS9]|uniref:hypothetical protein n=1 Tax=Kordia sp. SMS9 TaxID=2282170 RepID=UPI000E0D21C5|nr:hypothetical protein [Kordia sp. SMS9]AXG71022.1 hypothetical protein KORDIASMS9_03277 [Kordia sp. SMS9]